MAEERMKGSILSVVPAEKSDSPACSGGTNGGRLSKQAVAERDRGDLGRMSCLDGSGGHLSGFVKSIRDVSRLLAVKGCPTGCARVIPNHLEIVPSRCVAVIESGVDKAHHCGMERSQVDLIKKAARGDSSSSKQVLFFRQVPAANSTNP